jgi:branched-chain amino acid transport system ATP-binding protein
VLEVEHLDAFYGAAQALWDVSLRLGDGEIVTIVGPNGAGKTTLVNAVAGIHREVRGRVCMDGADLVSLRRHRVGDLGIAIVPEGRHVFARMTVADNLDMGAYRRSARASRGERLERVFELFPLLRERRRQLAGTLSGGEQQMLAIGRALMSGPRALLMDEPSLGLAPAIVDEVFGVIVDINAMGVGVLLVEQNVRRALDVSTRGYLLVEGRVVLEGRPDELLEDPLMQRATLGV